MPKLRSILLALAFAFALGAFKAKAQLTPLQDPANLAGERVSPQDPADTLPLNHGAPALQQLLAKLRTRASLMLIVAHPDDEDGGLLTYESRGRGARVAMLTLTRGEGGQNLMSADFDDALGLIRTQELLAADRYFGVDQFFGTEVDFGFSKTKEESFQKWTHERVLYDAVRAVRLYRPLVIASVFVGGPTDGHGQHQVAGEIAQEVFVAAADPTVFPEMIAEGLLPWAPLKVYARVPFSRVTPEGMYDYATGKTVPTRFHNYVTGEDSTAVPTATVLIHEGDKPSDPTLAAAMGGDTFLQFARKGLALQKTQIGPNVRLAPAGAFDAGYTLMASRLNCPPGPIPPTGCPTFATASPSLRWASPKPATEQSLFDGIDTTLPGTASLLTNPPADTRSTLIAIDQQIAEAQRLFDPAHEERIADRLVDALGSLDNLIGMTDRTSPIFAGKQAFLHELRVKRGQLNGAVVLATGVAASAQIKPSPEIHNSQVVVGGQDSIYTHPFKVAVSISSPRTPMTLCGMQLNDLSTPLTGNQPLDGAKTISIGSDQQNVLGPSRPYFGRTGIEQPFYDIGKPALRNAPSIPPLAVHSCVTYRGTHLDIISDIQDGTTPISLVPPLSATISPSVQVRDIAAPLLPFFVTVRSNTHENIDANLRLATPFDWSANPTIFQVDLSERRDRAEATFTVRPRKAILGKTYSISPTVDLTPYGIYGESVRPVGYSGLPSTNFYSPPVSRITAVDLHTAPNLHIAYLPGTGDPVPDFLPNLGITPTLLTLKDLNSTTINKYDAILLGVRAYAAHPELAGPGSQPLLDYAKQGGVVILQYNTARFGDAEAPFPIDVPGDPAHNVVEEAQPVTLLHPGAPLLTWPNKITAADFDDWVAERGHGFAATWSPQYQPLLETHDVGQDSQQGGLLLARTGKGAYIYCALALYRQLPEGVPGAYRLLANLLSYAKNPTR